MFSPIKNLITYIQKNASGTSLFGGSAVEAGVVQVTPESETKSTQDSKKTDCKEVEEVYEEILSSREELKKLREMEVSDINPKVTVVENVITNIPLGNFDEDDIEMQIKSNTVLRRSFDKTTTTNTNIAIDHDDEIYADADNDSSSSLVANKSETKNHDYNQNHEIIDVELEDFRHDPVPVVIEDFCSVSSVGSVEDENEEAPFLDLTHELDDTFPIIVINEPDLNSSINSDVLSEDPLAIEDIAAQQYTTKSCSDNNHLDTHHTDSPGDILWINIDDIKSCVITQKDSCESTPTTTSQEEVAIVSDAITSTASCSKDLSETLPEPNTSVIEEEHATEELRGDGSDSGLGSETSALQTTLTSATDTSLSSSAAPTPAKILRSNLKRRLETTEDDSFDSTGAAESSAVSNAAIAGGNTNQKKPKRSINFENVQVYYFPRQQGFGCVPSAGGCTLGMGARHISFKTLTLTEHAAELRRAHRQQLQEVNPRGSSSEDSEESEEDYLSEGSGSDLDAESSGFLQPVSPKQRRALLKAAGIRKIDASEKAECRDIRNSREVCGCTCRDFCDPETCACSQAGIKCQVDRAMFPCGCSRDACGNTVGRVEFNPSRVRTHFIHTIMRLEMESRHQQKPLPASNINFGQSSSINALNMSNNYYSMQSQSNYSSGYASPAYPNEQTLNYYQQQNQLYSRNGPDVLGQTHHQQYQVDSCLESSLFCGTATGSPSYGELMPAYSSVSAASGTIPTSYHAPLSYPTVQHSISATVSPFSTSNYLPSSSDVNSNNSTTLNISGYSSCAVPSAPPFGTATTTAASAHYHSNCNPTLETTTAASSILDINSSSTVGSTSSFISLNSPISSSTRLSAINDLLQHNRNTTAALVAVSNLSTNSSNLLCSTKVATLSESTSIDTPPIEYTSHKSCLTFEEIPAPLNPTPIVAVLEEEQQENKSKNVAFDSNTNMLPTKPLQTEPPPARADIVVAAAAPADTVVAAATAVEQSIIEVSIN